MEQDTGTTQQPTDDSTADGTPTDVDFDDQPCFGGTVVGPGRRGLGSGNTMSGWL